MDILNALIAFIVGAVVPIILQAAKSHGWELEGWKVQLISLGVAIVTAVVAIVIAGKFDLGNAIGTITLCLTTTELVYTQIIKKIG